jgi:lipoyl(octanoyl) transferase
VVTVPAASEIVLVRVPERVPYRRGLELQRALGRARIEGHLREDLLLLVEHDPVVTLGRTTGSGHLMTSPDTLAARGIDVVEIERGGDVTYHGPGQLVGYPIMDLGGYRRDLHWYLRTVEDALIRTLAALELPAFRVAGHTGVWVGDEMSAGPESDAGPAPAIAAGRVRKIASIGIHVSRWVTWHGFALNVTGEPLESFGLIVPCGIEGVRMTSLETETGRAGGAELDLALSAGVAEAFGARIREETRTLDELAELAGWGRTSPERMRNSRPEAEAGGARPAAARGEAR